MHLTRFLLLGCLGSFALVAACGSDDDADPLPTAADGGGTTGASSSSGGIQGGDGGNGSSSSGDGGYAQCATSTLAATRDPLRIAVALDKSNSLCQTPGDGGADCASPDSLRSAVWNALKGFFEAPTSVGLQASLVGFAGGTCKLNLPASGPPVDLPDQAHVLWTALDGPGFAHEAGTQTVSGIASARKILKAPDAPDTKSAVLLVTDGLPTSCPDNETSGLDLAIEQIELTRDAGIPVYVIGIASYKNENSIAFLDQMAAAAGTNGGQAVRVDQGTPQEVTSRLLAALDTIRNVELSCEVPLPVPAEGTIDPALVNVQLTAAAGTIDATQSEGCADARGWQYEQVDGGETKIVLCPALCADSKVVGTTVNVILGCETRTSTPH